MNCRKLISIQHLPWVLLATFAVLVGFKPLRDSDTFFYLASAREIIRNWEIPSQDPFIAAALPLVVSQQWLGHIIWYLSWLGFGFIGIVILKLTVFFLSVVPAYVQIKRNQNVTSSFHFSLWLLGFLAFSIRYNERTSIFGDLLFVFSILLMVLDLNGNRRAKWFLPIISVLWINMHGSYPLILIFGLWWLVVTATRDLREWGPRIAAFALSIAIWILNPLGLKGILFSFQFMDEQYGLLSQFIVEHVPTLSESVRGNYKIWCYIAFLCLAFMHLVSSRLDLKARKTIFLIGVTVALTAQGLLSVRYVTLSILGILFSVEALSRVRAIGEAPSSVRMRSLVHAVAVGVLIVLTLSGVMTHDNVPLRIGTGIDKSVFPTTTLKALQQLPVRGPTLNAYFFGGYLAWALEGKRKILIHGFVIDEPAVNEFLFLGQGRKVIDHMTQKYGFDSALIAKTPLYEPVRKALIEHPEWYLAVEDPASLLYLRKF